MDTCASYVYSSVIESSLPNNEPVTSQDFSLDSNPYIMYVKSTRITKLYLFTLFVVSMRMI